MSRILETKGILTLYYSGRYNNVSYNEYELEEQEHSSSLKGDEWIPIERWVKDKWEEIKDHLYIGDFEHRERTALGSIGYYVIYIEIEGKVYIND